MVGQHHHLRARVRRAHDLVDGLVPSKRILAGERIVENNNALGQIGLALQMGKEEGERRRGTVTG